MVNAPGCFFATRQKLRIAQIAELWIEEFPRGRGIGHTPRDQQLRHHGRNAGLASQSCYSIRVVAVDAPSLRHKRSGVRGQGSETGRWFMVDDKSNRMNQGLRSITNHYQGILGLGRD